jgi:hypothetical protein
MGTSNAYEELHSPYFSFETPFNVIQPFIDPAQNECIGFRPLRQEKGAKTGHGVTMLRGRINKAVLGPCRYIAATIV